MACLAELRTALALRGLPLLVRVGSAVDVLAQLHSELAFTHLLSHEETGPGWSYVRDVQVAAWCKSVQLPWQEFTQTGVVRRLRSRSGWAGRWQARMDAPLQLLNGEFTAAVTLDQPELPTLASLGLRTARQDLASRGRESRAAHAQKLSASARLRLPQSALQPA